MNLHEPPDQLSSRPMGIERVIERIEGYDFHSRHFIGDRDMDAVSRAIDGVHPVYGGLFCLRGRRVARRKEVYETLFVLDQLHAELRRVRALVDLSAGHGLTGLFALLIHRNLRHAVLIDKREPLCFGRAREYLAARYPFLKTRSRFLRRPLAELVRVPRGVFVVGVHCCGGLTDHVARMARAAAAPFAVVPCCESRKLLPHHLQPRKVLHGDQIPTIVNDRRLVRWREWGYEVEERALPREITERPRLLVARPGSEVVPQPDAVAPWPSRSRPNARRRRPRLSKQSPRRSPG